jgi:hypothetical protein
LTQGVADAKIVKPTLSPGELSTYDTSVSPATGSDDGTTYWIALQTINDIIAYDIAQDPKWDYVVVFMSDGAPTDDSTKESLAETVDSLRSMVNAKGHQLTFSTVYFDVNENPKSGFDDDSYATALDNLQAMATEGKGQFLNTNLKDGSLVIGDIISVPGEVCTSK